MFRQLIYGSSIAAVGTQFGIDSLYYGRPTFTPLNFLRTNLSVASFYGVNRWDFYLTQGVPVLCMTALPFVIHGISIMAFTLDKQARARYTTAIGLMAWTAAIYSLGSHKEWRFIHPLLPLMHVCAAKSLVDLASGTTANQGKLEVKSVRAPLSRGLPIRGWHLALLLFNVLLIPYVSLVHGRAQIQVMRYLRSLPHEELDTVGFLMPCHSTPWQSHLHRRELAESGRLWAIGCEPPLGSVHFTKSHVTE
jgi:phosphatidylinositol glycan class B